MIDWARFDVMDSYSKQALTRAFDLAYFIHRDKQPALLIAIGALSKLEVAVAAQDKRLYYTPAGRAQAQAGRAQDAGHRRPRTKVAMSDLHLLQRLVYVESEHYEKKDEEAGSVARLDEEDMIIRFIKHLVRITTRRNSFYVALGLSRLLYQYTTNETAEIYDLIIQDSDRFKDDHYYRSRKRRLIQELSDRFGGLIRLARSKGGEERFESVDDSRTRLPFVSRCLDQFTPWNTACPLPDRRDLQASEIRSLKFDGSDPDQEHPVEIRRMHSVIHPGCFSRLVAALALDHSDKRLTVPRFAIDESGGDGGRPPADRNIAPILDDEELMLVGAELAENARRRKTSSARLLAIKVDGADVATIDVNRQSSISFQVDDTAELIEVVTRDAGGELLLATHLLTFAEGGAPGPSLFAIQLEGGQKLAFKLGTLPRAAGLMEGFLVEVSYSESALVPAMASSARRFLTRVSDIWRPGPGRAPILSRPALAAGLTLVIAAGILLYLRPWRPPEPALVAVDRGDSAQSGSSAQPDNSAQPGNAGAGETQVIPAPGSNPGQPDSNKDSRSAAGEGPVHPRNANVETSYNKPRSSAPQALPEAPVARDQRPGQNQEAVPDPSAETVDTATRSSGPRVAPKQLSAIKRIYIANLGGGQFGDSIRLAIAEALDRTGHLKSVQTQDQADAVLKGTAIASESGDPGTVKGKLSIKLIAADGSILWSWPHPGSGSNPVETSLRMATLVSNDLLENIQAASRK